MVKLFPNGWRQNGGLFGLSKVFSVRISKQLFDKINSEINNRGVSRKDWFLGLYNSKKPQRTPVYSSVYKRKGCYDYNTTKKIVDDLLAQRMSYFNDSVKTQGKTKKIDPELRETLLDMKKILSNYKTNKKD